MSAFIITGAAALVPSIFLLWYFISSDRFPEPTGVLIGTFARGVLICFPVVVAELLVSGALNIVKDPVVNQLLQAFLVAGLCEEAFKLWVLHRYCARSGHLDEPMDGVVYGVVVSLGFATFENILYVSDGGLQVALMRAVTAVPAHAAFGAMMGYAYSQYRFGFGGRRVGLSTVLAIPLIVHGLYDAPLFVLQVPHIQENSVFAIGLLGFFVALLIWMFRRTKRIVAELKASQHHTK